MYLIEMVGCQLKHDHDLREVAWRLVGKDGNFEAACQKGLVEDFLLQNTLQSGEHFSYVISQWLHLLYHNRYIEKNTWAVFVHHRHKREVGCIDKI